MTKPTLSRERIKEIADLNASIPDSPIFGKSTLEIEELCRMALGYLNFKEMCTCWARLDELEGKKE